MVNSRETLDLTTFAGPPGNAVDWRISGSWGALCTVSGSAQVAAQAGDGVLDVTRGSPLTYFGQGATAIPPEITITCPDGSAKAPYPAAALWFSPSEAGGFQPSASPTSITGQRSGTGGTFQWNLTRLP